VGAGDTVTSFCWDREGKGAFARVTPTELWVEPSTGKLYWVPVNHHATVSPLLVAADVHGMRFDLYWGLSRWLSSDGEWLALIPTDCSGSASHKCCVELRQWRGKGRYTVELLLGSECSTQWSPVQPLLAVISTALGEEEIEVRICNPIRRHSETVFRFKHPDHTLTANIVDWSADGQRLLIEIRALHDYHRSYRPRFTFKPFKWEIPASWLVEIDLQTRRANMLYKQQRRQVCLPLAVPESEEGVKPNYGYPWFIGYDREGNVLLLKDSHELLRLDPETHQTSRILRW
jgi:hypothetical protein